MHEKQTTSNQPKFSALETEYIIVAIISEEL